MSLFTASTPSEEKRRGVSRSCHVGFFRSCSSPEDDENARFENSIRTLDTSKTKEERRRAAPLLMIGNRLTMWAIALSLGAPLV